MDRSKFFEQEKNLDFASYLSKTHCTFDKTKLSSLKAILEHYIEDLRRYMKKGSHEEKVKLGRLKTKFSNTELKDLIKKDDKNESNSNNSTNVATTVTTFGTTHVAGDLNLNFGSQERAPADKPVEDEPLQKRRHIKKVDPDFVDSTNISDSSKSDDPSSALTASSYIPSDLKNSPCGFTWLFDNCELKRNDTPPTPSPILNSTIRQLFEEAQQLVNESHLFPFNLTNRLQASAIFKSSSTIGTVPRSLIHYELPESIYSNIRSLQRSIQQEQLYLPPNASTSIEEFTLNNILTSIYTFHGRPLIQSTHSEIHLIATSVTLFMVPFFSAHDPVQLDWDVTSWIYKQQNEVNPNKLRPDIVLNIKGENGVIEIGCGEVKKDDADYYHKEEAKIRVLEIMKRQLHLRLKSAKKEYQGATFGFVFIGTEVTLLEMKLDLEHGAYIYEEYPCFTLPTTYSTHTHLQTSMETMSSFKNRILGSLLKAEHEKDNDDVWSQHRDFVRPTAAAFEPLYDED